jgi:hypothetical protein
VGKFKARFFREGGFDESTIEFLVREVLRIARRQEVIEISTTVHGQKYVLEGELETPSGRRLRVRTIWIIDRGQERPRLVTAYPGQGEDKG